MSNDIERLDDDVVRRRERSLTDRLIDTYRTALEQQNGGAEVRIHVGTETLRQMKALATVPALHAIGATCWGFPLVEEPAAATEHLSVHTIHTIA